MLTKKKKWCGRYPLLEKVDGMHAFSGGTSRFYRRKVCQDDRAMHAGEWEKKGCDARWRETHGLLDVMEAMWCDEDIQPSGRIE